MRRRATRYVPGFRALVAAALKNAHGTLLSPLRWLLSLWPSRCGWL
jgi:hypothetical protein